MRDSPSDQRAHDGLDAGALEALRTSGAYPAEPGTAAGIEEAQTHISWVFLTAGRVYKFRKPVSLVFVDFSSRAARNADCERELELNRRLAPDVYLGVAPLEISGGRIRIGALAERTRADAEHCVVMRRLPAGRDALSLSTTGALTAGHVTKVAQTIAAFHRGANLGVPAPWSARDWLARVARPVRDNFRALAEHDELPSAALADARDAAERALAARADAFERRRADGRAVDGHGDLHLAHVWFENDAAAPLVIDCLEFNDELRRGDAAADVAFFAMDLVYRGADSAAERFLAEYATASDDHDLYSVVDYYVAYRAAVRAKVAALAAHDANVAHTQRERAAESARKHLKLAAAVLERPPPPALVLLCGVVGTGKSTVAEALAAELCVPCVSSDRVRERVLAGVARVDRYTDARRRAVYDAVLERARTILRSGRTAVLDATFESRALRQRGAELAREAGAAAWLVEVRAARAIVMSRLVERSRAGSGASDAGPEQYDTSTARFEAPSEWPAERHVVVATDAAGWREAAVAAARRIGGRAPGAP